MRALGLQVKDAAEAFGLPPNKVWQMLAARRRVQPEELATWARLLRAPMSTIFKRMDYPWEPGAAPVDGIATEGGAIAWLEAGHNGAADGVAHVSAPYPEGASGDLHALVLDVQLCGFARGTVLYFEPYERVDRAAFGRLSIIMRGAGDASYVGTPAAIDEGRTQFRALGSDRSHRLDRIISATPVRWIRAAV
jgi:hypothetical protein